MAAKMVALLEHSQGQRLADALGIILTLTRTRTLSLAYHIADGVGVWSRITLTLTLTLRFGAHEALALP